MKTRWVVLDAEFDSLSPTRVWTIVCKDINTREVFTFRYDHSGFKDFLEFTKTVLVYVGANIIGYDYPNMLRLIPGFNHDPTRLIDLQIISRLVWFERPGGHSVENFAKKYGMVKPPIKVYDDPNLIDEYVHRCQEDVEITYRMWLEFERFIRDKSWAKAIRVEHDMAFICWTMKQNGFAFNVKEAEYLLNLIKIDFESLSQEIISEIGDVLDSVKTYTLKRKDNGEPFAHSLKLLGGVDTGFKDGDVHEVHLYRPFNPASPKDRILYLNECKWEPYVKTDGHQDAERDLRWARRKRETAKVAELEKKMAKFKVTGWKICEENLETLPKDAPLAARKLAQWLTLNGRLKHLTTWLECVDRSDGRIHGNFMPIGAWTQRMAHSDPNGANIFGVSKEKDDMSPIEEIKVKWDGRLRATWVAAPNHLLVGTDAEGIQLRILAHCMDDEDYAFAVANGRKEDQTDVHNVNLRALALNHLDRDMAKTWIYAWLLGAGKIKQSSILKCTAALAEIAENNFLDRLPKLKELRQGQIPRDASNGYFVGVDGRKVMCDSEHLMLAGYLQNGEACVMKHANVLWVREAKAEGLPFKQVNFVHDEWQTEVKIVSPVLLDAKGKPYTAESARLGELQRNAIRRVGLDLGIRCPLAGTTDTGYNWKETH